MPEYNPADTTDEGIIKIGEINTDPDMLAEEQAKKDRIDMLKTEAKKTPPPPPPSEGSKKSGDKNSPPSPEEAKASGKRKAPSPAEMQALKKKGKTEAVVEKDEALSTSKSVSGDSSSQLDSSFDPKEFEALKRDMAKDSQYRKEMIDYQLHKAVKPEEPAYETDYEDRAEEFKKQEAEYLAIKNKEFTEGLPDEETKGAWGYIQDMLAKYEDGGDGWLDRTTSGVGRFILEGLSFGTLTTEKSHNEWKEEMREASVEIADDFVQQQNSRAQEIVIEKQQILVDKIDAVIADTDTPEEDRKIVLQSLIDDGYKLEENLAQIQTTGDAVYALNHKVQMGYTESGVKSFSNVATAVPRQAGTLLKMVANVTDDGNTIQWAENMYQSLSDISENAAFEVDPDKHFVNELGNLGGVVLINGALTVAGGGAMGVTYMMGMTADELYGDLRHQNEANDIGLTDREMLTAASIYAPIATGLFYAPALRGQFSNKAKKEFGKKFIDFAIKNKGLLKGVRGAEGKANRSIFINHLLDLNRHGIDLSIGMTGGQVVKMGIMSAMNGDIEVEKRLQLAPDNDVMKHVGSTLLSSYVIGVGTGGLGKGFKYIKGKLEHQKSGFSFKEIEDSLNDDAYIAKTKASLLARKNSKGKNKMSEAEYNERLKILNEEITAVRGVKNSLPQENRQEAAEIILERNRIEKDIEGKEGVAAEKEQIKILNERLDALGMEMKKMDTELKETEVKDKPLENEIPEDEIAALAKELESGESEGSLSENKGERVWRGEEEGVIVKEGQGLTFETKDRRYDLGNEKEVGGTAIADKGFTRFSKEGIDSRVKAEGKKMEIVEIEGKRYRLIEQSRDKNGETVAKMQEVTEAKGKKGSTKGVVRKFKGEQAEWALKELGLQKHKPVDHTVPSKKRPKTENVKYKTKEQKAAAKKEARKPKEEPIVEKPKKEPTERKETPKEMASRQRKEAATEKKRKVQAEKEQKILMKKSSKELDVLEKKAAKEAKEFEEGVAKDIAKESDMESKNGVEVKYGKHKFRVKEKKDGEHSVVVWSADKGKYVTYADKVKRPKVIDKFGKEKSKLDDARIKEAEDIVKEFKNESEDKILNWMDAAVKRTSLRELQKSGMMFEASLVGAPIALANASLRIVRATYIAGKDLSRAVKEGYNYMKSNGNPSTTEAQYKKWVIGQLKKPKGGKIIPKKAVAKTTTPTAKKPSAKKAPEKELTEAEQKAKDKAERPALDKETEELQVQAKKELEEYRKANPTSNRKFEKGQRFGFAALYTNTNIFRRAFRNNVAEINDSWVQSIMDNIKPEALNNAELKIYNNSLKTFIETGVPQNSNQLATPMGVQKGNKLGDKARVEKWSLNMKLIADQPIHKWLGNIAQVANQLTKGLTWKQKLEFYKESNLTGVIRAQARHSANLSRFVKQKDAIGAKLDKLARKGNIFNRVPNAKVYTNRAKAQAEIFTMGKVLSPPRLGKRTLNGWFNMYKGMLETGMKNQMSELEHTQTNKTRRNNLESEIKATSEFLDWYRPALERLRDKYTEEQLNEPLTKDHPMYKELKNKFGKTKQWEILEDTHKLFQAQSKEALNQMELSGKKATNNEFYIPTKFKFVTPEPSMKNVGKENTATLYEQLHAETPEVLETEAASLKETSFGMKDNAYMTSWDFLGESFSRFDDVSKEMYMSRDLTQLDAFIKSNGIRKLFSDKARTDAFMNEIKKSVNYKNIKDQMDANLSTNTPVAKIVTNTLGVARRGMFRLLIGVGQRFKQLTQATASIVLQPKGVAKVTKTMVQGGRERDAMVEFFSNNADVATRNTMNMIDTGFSGKENAAGRFLSKVSIGDPDFQAASMQWLSSYESRATINLKGTGKKFKWENQLDKPDMEALGQAYMETMMTQGSSIPEFTADLIKNPSGFIQGARVLTAPFTTFIGQAKMEILTDMTQMHTDPRAGRRVAGTVSALLAFGAVSWLWDDTVGTEVHNKIVDEVTKDTEDGEFLAKALKQIRQNTKPTFKQKMLSVLSKDVFGSLFILPGAAVDNAVTSGVNWAYYKIRNDLGFGGNFQNQQEFKQIVGEQLPVFEQAWDYLLPEVVYGSKIWEITNTLNDGRFTYKNKRTGVETVHVLSPQDKKVLEMLRLMNYAAMAIPEQSIRKEIKRTSSNYRNLNMDNYYEDRINKGEFDDMDFQMLMSKVKNVAAAGDKPSQGKLQRQLRDAELFGKNDEALERLYMKIIMKIKAMKASGMSDATSVGILIDRMNRAQETITEQMNSDLKNSDEGKEPLPVDDSGRIQTTKKDTIRASF